MKRFLTAIAFCVFLLASGLVLLSPATRADGNILAELLKLPAPPPPNPNFQVSYTERDEDFYDKESPPKDDAAVEEVLDYWRRQNNSPSDVLYDTFPSKENLRKILAEIEKNPEDLTNFLGVLPPDSDVAESVKRFYDQEVANKNLGKDWRDTVKNWLTYNSNYYSDDLLKLAQKVGDQDEYVTNQDDLIALAKVDWDKARPLLERLINDKNQPVSQVLARWIFYRHALETDDSSDIEKYRNELKAVVEDKTATAGMRDLAFDALSKEKDWDGRDEWYFSLLGDETLADLQVNGRSYTGLTTLIHNSPRNKYIARMIEFLKSDSKVVRTAAIRNLSLVISKKNPEIIRALLPWLENPDWATDIDDSRRKIVSSLAQIKMPESVPALIALLNEKGKRRISINTNLANMAYNSSPRISNRPLAADEKEVEYFRFRSEAVQALAFQRDIRAVAPLRAILPESEGWEKQVVMTAIYKCGGYSANEQLAAVEAVARNNSKMMEANFASNALNAVVSANIDRDVVANVSNVAVNVARVWESEEFMNLRLGEQIIADGEPSDELVAAMVERIGALEKREPNIAFAMRAIMRNWRGTAVNAMLLRDLQNNKAEVEDVVKLLARRKELREKQFNDIYAIRAGSPIALGISACLLEDAGSYDAILSDQNNEAKTAMLACARLIRARLPIQKVAENLSGANKTLALAAEKYLESEDSSEARAIVWSLHPNEAKILGARAFFGDKDGNREVPNELFASVSETQYDPVYYFYQNGEDLDKTQEKLQKEIIADKALIGVYSYDNNFIRIFKDKAVFSWEEDPARYRERVLEESEFERFKNYIASQRADELPPFFTPCSGEDCGNEKELLMLGKNGGRRVYLKSYKTPPFFAELDKMFEEMRRPPAKLKYYLQNEIAGLEILYADDNLEAETVWKNGADFRVLTNSEQRREQIQKELEEWDEAEQEKINGEEDYAKYEQAAQKRREMREYENYVWYRFDGAKLLETISQPAAVGFIPPRDGMAIQPDQEQWKKRTATFELRDGDDGLYKIAGGRMTKIRKGYYQNTVVSANGNWAVSRVYGSDDNDYVTALVRINLLTGKEFKIPSRPYPPLLPITFVPSQNKFLTGMSMNEYAEPGESKYYTKFYWLDAETGVLQPAKDNVQPLTQQTFRALQPVAGKPDEFWVALPDSEKNLTQFGTFNAKTLTFKPLQTIPKIEFDSMKMWVSEPDNKIFFAYSGQVLSLPLPKMN